MNQNRFSKQIVAAAVVALITVLPAQTIAGLNVPYTPDPGTLHLWHLDEANGTTAEDAVTSGAITLNNLGMPVGGSFTNTTFGASGFNGLGSSVSATTKQHVLYGGAFQDVFSFSDPETGAFTFEAVVKFATDPLGAIDAEIVSGDNGLGIANRGWQWRIFNGDMEWDLLAGSTDNDFKAHLPTTGPNAAIVGAWYHVAVSYSGFAPSNGDAPNVITFYWTLLDENRTEADVLATFEATRSLDGSPQGPAQPSLGIAGSARVITNNPGNNEGLIGSIDEVRISGVARKPGEMAFKASGGSNPPVFTTQPPTNTIAPYGQPLVLAALVSGTPPLNFTWLHSGITISGQVEGTLTIPNATFADGGAYQLVASNSFGAQTSTVAHVTIGASANGLFNTGLDTNGIVSSGDIPDPHWTLLRSADPFFLGPDALIFENSFPIQFGSPDGSFSPTNSVSMWIGASGNPGGSPATSPAGNYVYRSKFLLDTADASTFAITGNLWVNGSISDIIVNGQSSGIAISPGGTLYVATFAITNGFVSGWNTIDFVETLPAAGIPALRVEARGVALALPSGTPVIVEEPADQQVRDGTLLPGSKAIFSVAALGRAPLSYQWLTDGAAIVGATNRTLTFINPTTGAADKFSVVVSNDSGSVTSRVATLNIVSTNQLPVAAPLNFVAFAGSSAQTLTIPLSDLVQGATDPDHDPVTFISADSSSEHGATVEQIDGNLIYTPIDASAVADQINYQISDPFGSAQAAVNILVLSPSANQVVPVGASATLSSGLSTVPSGYSFQWQLNGTNISSATGAELTITNAQAANAGSYMLVVTDPQGRSWNGPVSGLTVGTLGSGTGLTGSYYSDTTNGVGEATLTRIDPTIDFNWGTDAPDPSISLDSFMVRWEGQVQPLYTDTYSFYTTTDDGARLWVNGQKIVDRWQNQAATTATGTISLQGGQKYNLVMEYYENTSTASAQLSWSSLHQAREVIPSTQLYPALGASAITVSVSRVDAGTLALNWTGIASVESADSINGPWTAVANNVSAPYTVPVSGSHKFFRLATQN